MRGISGPLVAQVEDEITGTGAAVHRIVIGIEGAGNAASSVQRDRELLLRLNSLNPARPSLLRRPALKFRISMRYVRY